MHPPKVHVMEARKGKALAGLTHDLASMEAQKIRPSTPVMVSSPIRKMITMIQSSIFMSAPSVLGFRRGNPQDRPYPEVSHPNRRQSDATSKSCSSRCCFDLHKCIADLAGVMGTDQPHNFLAITETDQRWPELHAK